MRVKSFIAIAVGLVLFVGSHFMINAHDINSMIASIIMGIGGGNSSRRTSRSSL